MATSEDVDEGAATPTGRSDHQRRRGVRRQVVTSEELEDLRELLHTLQAELRALRRENELLRRAQFTDPWRFSGPYYPLVHRQPLAHQRWFHRRLTPPRHPLGHPARQHPRQLRQTLQRTQP